MMTNKHPTLEEFLHMPVHEVAGLVKASGSKVVVFPINGTRRWFALEYGNKQWENPIAAYMDFSGKKHVELYRLFFDHGIKTLLTPAIGPEILATRDTYMQKIGAEGLARLATHPDFLSFYEEYRVRIHFYGEYRKHLVNTPYEHLIELFDTITSATHCHSNYRLFFGAFADQMSVAETVAEFAVQYHAQHGAIPDRKAIIEMYYGEYIEKADIFIGFDRFAAFDYPLLNTGEEDLYFTVAPSSYMTSRQLRTILYDHLFTRRMPEVEHSRMSAAELQPVRAYYQMNQANTVGVGRLLDGTWVPGA